MTRSNTNKIIAKFSGKRILILGFGLEGQSSLRFLQPLLPNAQFVISDQLPLNKWSKNQLAQTQNNPQVNIYAGDSYLESLDLCDVIIKTPGIPYLRQLIQAEIKGKLITSNVQLFLETVEGKVIGVTGTKGKSTTASVTYHILKHAGLRPILAGNIGRPTLPLILEDNPGKIYVLELSSHQLRTVSISPHIAIFMNFYPEHLDYNQTLEEYFSSKANITLFQTPNDYFIYNLDFAQIVALAEKTQAQAKGFSLSPQAQAEVYLENDSIKDKAGKVIARTDSLALKGKATQNYLPAILVSQIYNISPDLLSSALKTYKPLQGHFPQIVGIYKRVTFVDDPLSTIPETTMLAVDSLGDRVQTLFLGGHERNLDYSGLAEYILNHPHIENLILFPITGERTGQLIKSLSIKLDLQAPSLYSAPNMRRGVEIAYEVTQPDQIALMSPGATSFSMFKDYKHRSNRFKFWVKKLGRNLD